jgi:hypothetical protein
VVTADPFDGVKKAALSAAVNTHQALRKTWLDVVQVILVMRLEDEICPAEKAKTQRLLTILYWNGRKSHP